MYYVIRSTFAVKPCFYSGDEYRWTDKPHAAARYSDDAVCGETLRSVARHVGVDVRTVKFQTIYDAELETKIFNDTTIAKVRISYRGFNAEFTREEFDTVLTDESGTDAAYKLAELLANADRHAAGLNLRVSKKG